MSAEGDRKPIPGISELPAVSVPSAESGEQPEPKADVMAETGDLQDFKRESGLTPVVSSAAVDDEEVVRLGVGEPQVKRFAAGGVELPGSVGIDSGLGIEAPLDREDKQEVEIDVEESWSPDRSRKSPLGLIVLTGLVVTGVLVVGFWKIPRGDALLDVRAAAVSEKLDAERQEQQEAAHLMHRIEIALRSYLAAETVGEKAMYVRHPERVKPLMERYYGENELVPQHFERVKSLFPVGVENYPFLVVRAGLESGAVLPLLLQQTGNDEILFDWESEVAYQPMSIAEFLERRPETGVDFRVYVRYDQFYAFEFSDQEKYLSLMLTERNSDAFVFAYVERGSEVHDEVARLLDETDAAQEAMLLKLRFLPGSLGTRSVLVEKVVAPRWAYVNGTDG